MNMNSKENYNLCHKVEVWMNILKISLAIFIFGAACRPLLLSEPVCDYSCYYCFRELSIKNGECSLVDIDCVSSCVDRNDCKMGHDCIDYIEPSCDRKQTCTSAPSDMDIVMDMSACTSFPASATKICNPYCEHRLCPVGFECVGTNDPRCMPVECGKYVTCQDAGKICNELEYKCYTSNGSCLSDRDCPGYDKVFSFGNYAEDVCDMVTGFCRLQSKLPDAIDPAPSIEIISPKIGASFKTQEDIELEWKAQSSPVIVLVTDVLPGSIFRLIDSAIWGIAVRADQPPIVRWSDGSAIRGGVWQAESSMPPIGVPLFLVVQAVDDGHLTAISRPIPFQIGKFWALPGDSCYVSPGEQCYNPTIPMTCDDRRCRVLCASHRDCLAQGLTACGPFLNAIRLCD